MIAFFKEMAILEPNVTNTLTKTNWDGSTQTLAVTGTPATGYTTTVPNTDGTKFEARRNVFDMLDEAISSLRGLYRDWETDRKSTRLNSSHSGESRMPSSA